MKLGFRFIPIFWFRPRLRILTIRQRQKILMFPFRIIGLVIIGVAWLLWTILKLIAFVCLVLPAISIVKLWNWAASLRLRRAEDQMREHEISKRSQAFYSDRR